ncbi:MAG: hypothetical protein EB127_12415 [Alphaproteobacteria bacterium]|nr:hypothetical protein [Alphaproteobacteria bacterium]
MHIISLYNKKKIGLVDILKIVCVVIPKPTLNQIYEFKGEDAEPTLVGEHSRDLKNSSLSFKVGNGTT